MQKLKQPDCSKGESEKENKTLCQKYRLCRNNWQNSTNQRSN
jgi:hypothetical protein